MAIPTMSTLANAQAEALSSTIDALTGIKHLTVGADAQSDPTHLANVFNQIRNLFRLVGPVAAGLVVSLESGLNVGVFPIDYEIGGVSKSYAGVASVSVTASSTNYIYVDTDETLKQSTSSWPAGDHFKLATVVADGSAVTSVTDQRFRNFQQGVINAWYNVIAAANVDMGGFGVDALNRVELTQRTELTIASGTITPTQLWHSVDTEGDASADDLITITAVAGERKFLILHQHFATRATTIKSTGNIVLKKGDAVLDDTWKYIVLFQYSDSHWVELFRNWTSLGQMQEDIDMFTFGLDDLGLVRFDGNDTLTLSAGAVTVTRSMHPIDTEGAAGADDLDTISGASAGHVITIRGAAPPTRIVTVKHNTGNIQLQNGLDYELATLNDEIVLRYNGTVWYELTRSRLDLKDFVGSGKAIPYPIVVNISGSLTVKTYEINVFVPPAIVIKDVTGVVNTAPSGGACIVDIHDDTNSIFTNQAEMVNIADGTTQDTSAVKNAAVAAGSILTFEVEASNGAADLTLMINAFVAPQTPPS